ncbi:MAG: outer membrane protein assembly factor BamD [Rhodobiaceae bacterium]|mgnify:FL=1|jgi:outer membrane protein assembly factor BamD|nr:outer membrane protein assembly factor BamD [Rhodobiaceae bacterium]|tara:strand:+ start:1598 stop:2368 length:771 start_codon:yes stop_codon:yes gene_type:complete
MINLNIKYFVKNSLFILIFGLLISCSSNDGRPEYRERTLEAIYNNALYNLERGRFQQAAFEFDEVERQHPYSSWARRAMLMSAYTYYLQNKYDEAISSAQRFISLHPGNKHAVYAYYLIGQSYYERISDVARDQKITEMALESFIEIIRRYPDTDYARDAQMKVDLTMDHLAGKEMYIGRYYLKQSAFLAAINRFRSVVVDYKTTSHTPEALHRIVEAYISLGLMEEAKATASVLGYNFPNSHWYKDSYELVKSFP